MTVTEITAQAEELGRDYGKSVGSWVIDGNTSKDQCMKIIEGYEDGDPEVMDMCPSPLSGEFADGPTVYSVLKELGFDPAVPNDQHDEIIDAYEDAFSESWWDTVIQAAYAQHGDFEPCGVCNTYGHKAKDHD